MVKDPIERKIKDEIVKEKVTANLVQPVLATNVKTKSDLIDLKQMVV